MSEIKRNTKQKPKRRRKLNTIFIVCIILLAIPMLFLGYFIVDAWLDSGKPVFGNRYKGDLDPAITKSQMKEIKSNVGGISGVESVEVELKTATLRVYADVEDSATVDSEKDTASKVYDEVLKVLDKGTYFTQHDDMKMYDLEVHVYNQMDDTESDGFAYVIETKTSSMTDPVVNVVSEPIDAELAQQLRDNVENRGKPTPTPDAEKEITITQEDTQPTQTQQPKQ